MTDIQARFNSIAYTALDILNANGLAKVNDNNNVFFLHCNRIEMHIKVVLQKRVFDDHLKSEMLRHKHLLPVVFLSQWQRIHCENVANYSWQDFFVWPKVGFLWGTERENGCCKHNFSVKETKRKNSGSIQLLVRYECLVQMFSLSLRQEEQ